MIVFAVLCQAQWYWQPAPLNKKDFSKAAARGYTVAFEYEVVEGEKLLTRVLEFGAQGLPVVLYQKGTNDNGDSINTVETIYKFDGSGRLIRETTLDRTEGSEWSSVYTYAKTEKPVKRVTVSIDPASTMYTYNPAGKLTKTYTTVRMAATDKDGNPTAKRIDKPQERATFSYDEKGGLKEMLVYNLAYPESNGKWNFKMAFTYNNKNQLIKLERINTEGNVYNTESYTYNEDCLLIRASTKREEEPVKTFVYEYCSTCQQSWKQ